MKRTLTYGLAYPVGGSFSKVGVHLYRGLYQDPIGPMLKLPQGYVAAPRVHTRSEVNVLHAYRQLSYKWATVFDVLELYAFDYQ